MKLPSQEEMSSKKESCPLWLHENPHEIFEHHCEHGFQMHFSHFQG